MPQDMQETLILAEPLGDIQGLEKKAEEFEEQAAKLATKAAALRQIIAGVQALNGDAETVLMQRSFDAHKTAFATRSPAPNGPRGPKAVLAIMAEQPDRVWKVIDLKRVMLERGFAPSPKAVEGSVKRLRETNEIEPAGYGFYKLPAATAASHEQEAA